jgi:hypothetical protein
MLAHEPESAARRPVAEWVNTVAAMIDQPALLKITDPKERVLHGQLLIYGLTRVDAQLREALANAGVLDELRRSITPDPETFFRHAPDQQREPPGASHGAKFVADTPATKDLLDREGFANTLAALIDYQRNATNEPVAGPILVHLYGAWGSGKTSLFGLLRRSLERPPSGLRPQGKEPQKKEKGWLCVEFNAWGHQRTAPPWWWLMDSVYREARTRRRESKLPPLQWLRRLRSRRESELPPLQWLRRLRSRRESELPPLQWLRRLWIWCWWWGLPILGVLFFAAALMCIVVLGITWINWATDALYAVMGFVGAAGSAVVLVYSAKSSLLVGSPRAAGALLRSGGDPLRRISSRYAKLIDKIGRNTLVFIDDLDRCQPAYVVELLEGLQTIFRDGAVTYLVAADREWVSESFQQVYADLGPVMSRPGRPLGYLFLEKTFAVSAPLPRPSAAAQQRYWRSVLTGDHAEAESIGESDRDTAKAQLADVSAEAAAAQAANLAITDLSGRSRALRERAAIKMAEAVTSGDQDHVLTPYLPLLEQNPRALKRLRNAYAVAAMGRFASLNIATADDEVDALIRWTILALRWPQLAGQITEQPQLLSDIQHSNTAIVDSNLGDLVLSSDLRRLLTEPVGDVVPNLESWVASEFGSNTAENGAISSAARDTTEG